MSPNARDAGALTALAGASELRRRYGPATSVQDHPICPRISYRAGRIPSNKLHP